MRRSFRVLEEEDQMMMVLRKDVSKFSKLAAVSLMMFLSCSRSDPSKVLTNFLNASLHGDNRSAYQYLSASDKRIKSLIEYAGSEQDTAIGRTIAAKTSFRIKSIEVHGSSANAIVDVTHPDFSGMLGELFGAAVLSGFAGRKGNDKETEALIKKSLSKAAAVPSH
jgi:hypothetical protein